MLAAAAGHVVSVMSILPSDNKRFTNFDNNHCTENNIIVSRAAVVTTSQAADLSVATNRHIRHAVCVQRLRPLTRLSQDGASVSFSFTRSICSTHLLDKSTGGLGGGAAGASEKNVFISPTGLASQAKLAL